jgi:hypothetical protein
MHPSRALRITVQEDGDLIFSMEQDRIPIGGSDIGNPKDQCAEIEFCACGAGGGRSPHTRIAALALIEAMEKDNLERPFPRS